MIGCNCEVIVVLFGVMCVVVVYILVNLEFLVVWVEWMCEVGGIVFVFVDVECVGCVCEDFVGVCLDLLMLLFVGSGMSLLVLGGCDVVYMIFILGISG